MEEKQKIKSFKDLYAWKEGHKLVLLIYGLTQKFPKDETFGLISQMRRAAVSITSNIAEGFSRNSLKEKIQFYSISQGSATELQNQLIISKDIGYVSDSESNEADAQVQKTHRILHGLKQGAKSFFAIVLFFILYSLFSIPAHAVTLSKPSNNLGLVGYWSFEDGRGTKATDFSGSGNIGTLTGINGLPTWQWGKLGQALNFDGSDDYVDVGTINLSTANKFTVSAWVRPDIIPQGIGIIGERFAPGNSNVGYEIGFNLNEASGDSRLDVGFYDGTWRIASDNRNTVPIGVWTHILGTWDGTNLVLYKNGSQVATSTPGGSLPASDHSTMLGRRHDNANTEFFDGIIDDIRIFNRTLTANQVKLLYQSGVSKFNSNARSTITNGLVGRWTMDGTDIKWTSVTAGTITDRSGMGNTGTLTSMNRSSAQSLGKIGQALNFDGTDDYVVTGAFASGVPGTSMTASAWIKTSTTDDHDVIINKNTQWWFAVGDNTAGNKGKLGFYGNGWVLSNSTVDDGVWHHVVATDDAGTVTFYIDGVSNGGGSTIITDASGAIYIGQRGDFGVNGAFDGLIDEARIYNRALSVEEIKIIYAEGRPGRVNVSSSALTDGSSLKSGLAGHWTFDGNDTAWTSVTTGTTSDRSGNGNTGTLTSMSRLLTPTIGRLGQALNFDGADDYVISPSLTSLTSVTLSAWVKPNSAGGVVFSELGQSTPNTGWHDSQMEVETDNTIKVCMWIGSLSCVTAGSGITYGQWYHVVMMYNLSTTTLASFVNGVAGGSTVATKQNPGTLYYAIGAIDSTNGGNGNYFSGSIDEVRIYDRALSADEILQLYNMGK